MKNNILNPAMAGLLLDALQHDEWQRKYIATILLASTVTDMTRDSLAKEIAMLDTDSIYQAYKA